MFFFRRKKLYEIETKVDRLLQMMESQSQDISDNEKNIRQFLAKILSEQTEILLNKNSSGVKDIETELKDTASRITLLVQQNAAVIQKLCMIQEKSDKNAKEFLSAIQKGIEEEQKIEKEAADKIDLVENEIRLLLINSVMEQIPEE